MSADRSDTQFADLWRELGLEMVGGRPLANGDNVRRMLDREPEASQLASQLRGSSGRAMLGEAALLMADAEPLWALLQDKYGLPWLRIETVWLVLRRAAREGKREA